MSHGRRVLSIATGTLASRVTGLIRVLVLAWVLGFTPIADSFNLANTVPNMLFDLVLGGVASATFIPVFVERLALDGERRAWRSISSVVTASTIVLAVASALAWFAAPAIIDGFTALAHSSSTVSGQRGLATSLLRWFAPQIFFYGVIGVSSALLNVRQRFAAVAWVPVANNAVCIAVLVWFHLVDPSPTLSGLAGTRPLLLLGLGTTAGVAVQFLCLAPSLARASLWRLSPRLDLADPAVRAVARLGSWTLLVVVANQAALYVVLAFAFGIGGHGPVSAYTYGWSFMQMPYAVVVVSVLAAITPQLAGLSTAGDLDGLAERLRFGLRQSLVIIVPCALFLMLLAQPLVAIALNHANGTSRLGAGVVLAVLAAGLPGFTVFQLCVRGLQSMQRARDVFALYLVENAVNVVLAIALGRHSLAGLTASVSLAYTGAAVLALAALRRRGVRIAGAVWGRHVRRSLYASLVAVAATAAAYAASGAERGGALVARFALALGVGAVVFVAGIALGSRRVDRRRSLV
ncbi:MAG TPA: lipid II flippase MurJ [Acidimicrobiales bacterium]|nr:lipid II flippase MurJ [Acidimicrobiales bacterium]